MQTALSARPAGVGGGLDAEFAAGGWESSGRGPASVEGRELTLPNWRPWSAPDPLEQMVRMPHLRVTSEAAPKSLIETDADIFRNFCGSMGRRKMDASDLVKSTTQFGMWAMGTVDQVRTQLVEEWKQFPNTPPNTSR